MSILKKFKGIVSQKDDEEVEFEEVDPVEGVTKMILELEKDYEELNHNVEFILTEVENTKKIYNDKINEINACTEKAKHLAQAGSPDMVNLARQSLIRRDKIQAEADNLKIQLDNQSELADERTENLKAFQASIDDAKSKKAELLARVNSTMANSNLHKVLNNISSKGLTKNYNTIEETAEVVDDKKETQAQKRERETAESQRYDDELAKLMKKES